MKTTVDIDGELLRKALAETGARSNSEVVELGLRSLLERSARRRLRDLFGARSDIDTIRRRR
jgi:Arc/MetJ family transcription regulator